MQRFAILRCGNHFCLETEKKYVILHRWSIETSREFAPGWPGRTKGHIPQGGRERYREKPEKAMKAAMQVGTEMPHSHSGVTESQTTIIDGGANEHQGRDWLGAQKPCPT